MTLNEFGFAIRSVIARGVHRSFVTSVKTNEVRFALLTTWRSNEQGISERLGEQRASFLCFFFSNRKAQLGCLNRVIAIERNLLLVNFESLQNQQVRFRRGLISAEKQRLIEGEATSSAHRKKQKRRLNKFLSFLVEI